MIARRSNSETEMFIATIVPKENFIIQAIASLEDFRYLGNDYFSGQVFCSTLDGHFVKAFNYTDGTSDGTLHTFRASTMAIQENNYNLKNYRIISLHIGEHSTSRSYSRSQECEHGVDKSFCVYEECAIVIVSCGGCGEMVDPCTKCVRCDQCGQKGRLCLCQKCNDCNKATNYCSCDVCKVCFQKTTECTCSNCNTCKKDDNNCTCQPESVCGTCRLSPCQCRPTEPDPQRCPKCHQVGSRCTCYEYPDTGKPDKPKPPIDPTPPIAPNAKKIFRNSNMTDDNWKLVEKMIKKIINNSM